MNREGAKGSKEEEEGENGKDGDRGYIAVEKLTLQSVGAAWIRLFTEDNKGYGYLTYSPSIRSGDS